MTDLHDRWPHRWISPKAVSKESDIEGHGVFAREEIKEGETVGVLGGIVVPADEIDEYREEMSQVGIQINENFFIVPSSNQERHDSGIFNHSCDPNAGFRDSITLVAIRDIEPGEEITFDYAFSETHFDSFECNCGSEECRGTIRPDDWKDPELQEEYGEYFSPYLKEKIDRG